MERQNVPVSMAGGLDTKTDPKQVVAGRFIELKNAMFTKLGALVKRHGVTDVGDILTSGTAEFITSFMSQLIAVSGRVFYALNATKNQWIAKTMLGAVVDASMPTTKVEKSFVAQLPAVAGTSIKSSMATYGTVEALAWMINGIVYYAARETVSGQLLAAPVQICAASLHVVVGLLGTQFVVVYDSGTELKKRTCSVVSPEVISAESTLWASDAALGLWDATVFNNRLYVVKDNAAHTLMRSYFDVNFTQSTIYTKVTTFGPTGSVAIFGGVAYYDLRVVWSRPNAGEFEVMFTAYDVTLATDLKTPTQIYLTSATIVAALSAVDADAVYANGDSTFIIFIGLANVPSGLPFTWRVEGAYTGPVTPTYTFVNNGLVMYGVFPVSRAFVEAAVPYVIVRYVSPLLQSTYLAVDWYGREFGSFSRGTAGPGNNLLDGTSGVGSPGSHERRVLLFERTLGLDAPPCVFEFSMNFDAALQSAELNGNLLLSGACPMLYDGSTLTEQGFRFFPEGVTTNLLDADVGATYSYSYVVCYEWTDSQGKVHRSKPSVPVVQQKNSVVGISKRVNVVIPILVSTRKTGVQCVVYRTTVEGGVMSSVFHRVGFILNTPSAAQTVTYVDGLPDLYAVQNATVYTQSGVLANLPAPPTAALAVANNRIFAIDSTDPTSVWYSHEMIDSAQPIEFASAGLVPMSFRCDYSPGPVVGISGLDGKLIIFKRDKVFYMTGRGPTSNGANDDFSGTKEIQTDGGCVAPYSIISAGNGVMYGGYKGIYLLDRGLGSQYIGADVEAQLGVPLTSSKITGAVNVAFFHQIRFFTDTEVLVYDYFVNQWAVFTSVYPVKSACLLIDSSGAPGFYIIDSTGKVYKESTAYADVGATWLQMRAKTSWLKVSGLQGFQRVRRMLLLCEYKSPHRLTVEIAYDYDPTVVQTFTHDQLVSATPYQMRCHLARQKCQAIQITISDSALNPGDATEGFNISGIEFEVGLKKGLNKLPASKNL